MSCYLESLIESLKLTNEMTDVNELTQKLHRLIILELDLAIFECEKAKSELLKASKNNITSLPLHTPT